MSARVEPGDRRVRLRLHYDGSGFAGWQVQPSGRTVQGELEAALARLTGAPGRAIAAGRTDAGVHATGQVVGVTVPARWAPEELRRALNAVMPRDVWVAEAAAAEDAFHARYDAVARGYVYRVGTVPVSRSPFLRGRCWPLAVPLPLDVLNDCAARIIGRHSFRGLSKSGQPQRGEWCTVHRAAWREWPGVGVSFHVAANRFLHHMVRYLVGTMAEAALGRRPVDSMDALLSNVDGVTTSPPAPAEGLYLTNVYYPGDDWSVEDTDEILS